LIGMNSRGLAEIVTHIFNPPVVAAPTFLYLILLERPANSLMLALIILFFATLLPLTMVVILSRQGIIPDIWASERESRVIPFTGAIISYLLGAAILVAARSPVPITSLMLCYVGNTLVMMLISLRWKISVHASGIAGPLTALVYLLGTIALPLLLLILLVGWARLKLKAHTIAQVATGALLTILTTWVQMGVYSSHL
jgi:membrane-associated phospholipid phosphatase